MLRRSDFVATGVITGVATLVATHLKTPGYLQLGGRDGQVFYNPVPSLIIVLLGWGIYLIVRPSHSGSARSLTGDDVPDTTGSSPLPLTLFVGIALFVLAVLAAIVLPKDPDLLCPPDLAWIDDACYLRETPLH